MHDNEHWRLLLQFNFLFISYQAQFSVLFGTSKLNCLNPWYRSNPVLFECHPIVAKHENEGTKKFKVTTSTKDA